jgi:predicted DNA-binding transcriptional regulator AlpA
MSETATTLDEIDVGALPAAATTEQAARLLGISRVGLWKMAENGTAPIAHFKVGRALRWPTAPILRLLGLDESDAGAAEPSADDTARDRPSTTPAA